MVRSKLRKVSENPGGRGGGGGGGGAGEAMRDDIWIES